MKLSETRMHAFTARQWLAHSLEDLWGMTLSEGYRYDKTPPPQPGLARLWGIPVVFQDWVPRGEILVVEGTEEDALRAAYSR